MRPAAAMAAVIVSLVAPACSDDDDTTATTVSPAMFCAAADRLIEGNRSIDSLGSDSFPDEVRQAFADLGAAYDGLRDAAPDEIADEVTTTAAALDEVIDVVAAAGYELSAVDANAYTPARDRYLAASVDVEAYLAQTC